MRLVKLRDTDLTLELHDHHDMVSDMLQEAGEWEPYETRLIKERLKPGDVMVDAGANIGYYSVLASRICGPAGSVFAFEPQNQNYVLLRKNIERNHCENVQTHRAGLWFESKAAQLHLNDENFGDHQLAVNSERSQETVTLHPGDDLLPGTIDFLKVDTQGAEFGVLLGMEKTLQKSPNLRMILEFWPYGLANCGHSADQLIQFLGSYAYDYSIIDQENERLVPTTLPALLDFTRTQLTVESQGFINLLVESK